MIRAVCFDLFETLITEWGRVKVTKRRMAEALGVDVPAFLAGWEAISRERETGGYPENGESIRHVLSAMGADMPGEAVELVAAMRDRSKAACFAEIDPEVLRVLRAVRQKGLALGLVSNCTWDDVLALPGSALFPLLDAFSLSCRVGAMKPDPAIFRDQMEKLGLRPEECLYVGDGGSHELEAARDFGMRPMQARWFPERYEGQPPNREGFPLLHQPEDVLAALEAAEGIEYAEGIEPEAFAEIQRAAGFGMPDLAQIGKALRNSAYVVAAEADGRPVGMGRVVGDMARVAYIQDLFVCPDYQGRGVGTEILQRLMRFIRQNAVPGTVLRLGLMAAKGREPFYERFGFHVRPSEREGAGIQRTLEIPG